MASLQSREIIGTMSLLLKTRRVILLVLTRPFVETYLRPTSGSTSVSQRCLTHGGQLALKEVYAKSA